MQINEKTIAKALEFLGKDPIFREKIVKLLIEAEIKLSEIDFNIREDITGPIVDAVYANKGKQMKQLKSGIDFYFLYRSKIARDFIMSKEEEPDHVWEPQTTKLLLFLSDKAKNIAIGGAYFGDHAILVATAIKEHGGICHCFEPNLDQLEMLKFNAKANKLKNVIANEVGLWDQDGIQLILNGNDSHAKPMQTNNYDTANSFNGISLNSYGKKNNISRFNLIMLDIEGGELPALKGADSYLAQPPGDAPHLIFEIHRNYVDWSNGLQNTKLIKFLRKFGYTIWAIRDYQSNVPMTGYPIELIEPEEVYLEGPPHGFNMLATKEKKITENRIFRTVLGVSPKLLEHRDPRYHKPIHHS